MTLNRQSVKSLSDHKAARTLYVIKPRTQNSWTSGLEKNKMVVPSCLVQMGGGGGEESERDCREPSEKYV